jgi:YD repeat-containing protein
VKGVGGAPSTISRRGLSRHRKVGVSELGGANVSYTYDALLRLTGAVRTTNATYSHTYAYDAADNRTSPTSTYDAANQMVTRGALSFSYDRNGNTLGYAGNGNSASFSYNAANQWTGATINGTGYAYTYDGLGRQVSRSQSGTRTDFWFDATERHDPRDWRHDQDLPARPVGRAAVGQGRQHAVERRT